MDFVLPYVDSSDPVWRSSAEREIGLTENDLARYRSWDTLRYVFRGVSEYMPFIDRIVLIVASKSQVPSWINPNFVRIIYHEDFIPAEYLPTFNSCTIESFLYNIEGLSEKFIYSNDDLFIINKCTKMDFFSGNQPNLKFVVDKTPNNPNIYIQQCRSGLNLLTDAVGGVPYPSEYILLPLHGVTPMTTECLQVVKALCGDAIKETISKVREPQNVNQYVYSYCQFYTDNYVDKCVSYRYCDLSNTSISIIEDLFLHGRVQWVCLNDSRSLQNYEEMKRPLLEILNSKYKNVCRFEVR